MNRVIKLLLPLLVVFALIQTVGRIADIPSQSSPGTQQAGQPSHPANHANGQQPVMDAFTQRQSHLQVQLTATVSRVLAEDNQGSRHQRFLLRLENGQTVLVAHNIDLAERVAGLAVGVTVTLAGEYEWNDKGGVIHWTHHDPTGQHPGGWIQLDGRRYQ